MKNDIIKFGDFLNENSINDSELIKLKNEVIKNVKVEQDQSITILTRNYKITIPTTRLKVERITAEIKYPFFVKEETYHFDGYDIIHKEVQKSPRIIEIQAKIFMPKNGWYYSNFERGLKIFYKDGKYVGEDILIQYQLGSILHIVKNLKDVNLETLTKSIPEINKIYTKQFKSKEIRNVVLEVYKTRDNGFDFKQNTIYSHSFYNCELTPIF
jgi:hypothetical protein